MPSYELRVAPSVDRVLARLPKFAVAAIVEFMTGVLLEDPHQVGKSLLFELAGYHSARRGAYRIIYRIDEATKSVLVVRIDHRADVYRTR